jgi:hypothetical protein
VGSDEDEALGRLDGPGVVTVGAGVDDAPGAGAVTRGAAVAGDALGLVGLGLREAWACWLQRSKSACVGVVDCPEATLPIASSVAAVMNVTTGLVVDMRVLLLRVERIAHSTAGLQAGCQAESTTS